MNESHVIVAIVAACLLCLFVNCFTPFASMLGTVSLYNMYCIYLSTDNFVQLQDLLYIRVGDNTTEMHTNLYSFDEHLSTPEMFSD